MDGFSGSEAVKDHGRGSFSCLYSRSVLPPARTLDPCPLTRTLAKKLGIAFVLYCRKKDWHRLGLQFCFQVYPLNNLFIYCISMKQSDNIVLCIHVVCIA